MKPISFNIPTILVVFGATGDLMEKKIAPALYHLEDRGYLPDRFQMVAVARRPLSQESHRAYLTEILSKHLKIPPEGKKLAAFFRRFSYEQVEFTHRSDYHRLATVLSTRDASWGVCSNKLFYLAVPPALYPNIVTHLAASGLTAPCGAEEGWTRVIVEKPFGKDLKTAKRLDALLGRLFREEQLYRIDHYLAKEMLQNILVFRFANNLFETSWDRRLIERIDIRLLEDIGVEDRGNFYDGVGALRDVGQNHLLQMLALVTMDHPGTLAAAAVREKRAAILETLRLPRPDDLHYHTFRAQYDGYTNIPGVAAGSATETYFKIHTELTHPSWQGVPVTLESGKRLSRSQKEIEITFRHPKPHLYPGEAENHIKNRVVIRLEPKEEIDIHVAAKKPGLTLEVEPRVWNFLFREREHRAQYTEEYEKLLLDCIVGDQMLFVSTAEIDRMWRFIDPILDGWRRNLVPLQHYRPDTEEIVAEAARVLEAPREMLPPRAVGIVGLGKIGGNIARRLLERNFRVVAFNRSPAPVTTLEAEGGEGVSSLAEFAAKLSSPRVVLLSVPAGSTVDTLLFGPGGLGETLSHGDIVIDCGNSFYKDSIRRARRLQRRGISLLDVGISGGPHGARYGAALMIGGSKKVSDQLTPIFESLSVDEGYTYLGPSGAGHFAKMIHNGIEYGMMQAIAEGFSVLRHAAWRLNLSKVAGVYNHGSVIESRLIGWLKEALEFFGQHLKGVSGTVGHTGEGEWTVATAKELKVAVKIIEEAVTFRIRSAKTPSYTGKILSALRHAFGGHAITTPTPPRGDRGKKRPRAR